MTEYRTINTEEGWEEFFEKLDGGEKITGRLEIGGEKIEVNAEVWKVVDGELKMVMDGVEIDE